MPRVKIDYIVSFSSESPEAPASNLLANEAGRGRWLCARGEASCSVLLQLGRSVQISSITIGAHHAALVEVLVGRTETPTEPFQVLVASSVFLSPLESRKTVEGDSNADRVRSFTSEQLASDVRARRWDRVRVVCSQPYNKHCKYGLSFIHIFSPESDTNTDEAVKTGTAQLKLPFALQDEESDDEFKPGALFAQHRAASQNSEGSTDAQIRQATSQAIKNQSDSSSKLVRTPIAKPVTKGDPREDRPNERHRNSLMYSEEDDRPNDKIDRLVNAHKKQQAKNSEEKANRDHKQKEKEKHSKDKRDSNQNRDTDKEKRTDDTSSHRSERDKNTHRDSKKEIVKEKRKDDGDSHRSKEDRNKTPQSNKRDRSASKHRSDDEKSNKKQKTSNKDRDVGDKDKLFAGPVSREPHLLLSDVVFVLSGYENPRRAAVRDAALALGARFQRDWGPTCTHLICAFPNTPKLKTVRASSNGASAIVVTAEWIERSAARCRRLPWQWFATEPRLKVARARGASGQDPPGTCRDDDDKRKPSTPNEDCDTDDEIEKVLRKQKARRISSDDDKKSSEDAIPSSSKKKEKEDLYSSRDSDVAFVRDERIRDNVTVSGSDSDATDKEETLEVSQQDISSVSCLPSFFEGVTFALHPLIGSTPLIDVNLVRRYVRAYGGEIVEPMDDEDIEVDYVLCLCGEKDDVTARGRTVRADWLWRCHEKQALCSPAEFAL